MSAIKLCMVGLLLAGLTTVFAGCSAEPPMAKIPPVEVVVSQPVNGVLPAGQKPEPIEDWDVYTGTVESKETVDVRARVRGHVKDVPFTEGEEIAEGALLFILDAEPFQADLRRAKGQLATWEAKLKLAEEQVALRKPLAEKGTVSREELLQSYAAKGEAVGGVEDAKGKITESELNIKYCNIQSPIAGRVGEALFTKGDLVNASGAESVLTTVVSVDPMYVKFNVNEQAIRNYRKMLSEKAAKERKADPKAEAAAPVELSLILDPSLASCVRVSGTKLVIPVELGLIGDVGFPYKGVVDFVDYRVDPATSSQMVRARFTNPKGPDGRRELTAGMFARIRVKLGDATSPLLVADRAILTDQSLKYVLVVNKAKDNVVERVDVVVSNRLQESGLRVVEAGLKGNEWVIVEGVNRARPGVTVKPTEAKMPRRPAAAK